LPKRITRNVNDPSVVVATRELKTIDANWAANKNAAPRVDQLQRVGDALFTLLAGLIGGMVGAWFYAKNAECTG
jgi:hypothetical protein